MTSKRWVEKGTLPRWQRLYAQWLTGRGGELAGSKKDYRGRYPTAEERSEKASELSGREVQVRLVALIEKRADFREYFERLNGDSHFLAKELASGRITKNFEARDAALEVALDRQPDGKVGKDADVRAVETFTRPYLEHAFPKKEDKGPTVQKFTINLIGASPETKQMLLKAVSGEPELQDVEYEVIETEKTEVEDE